MKSITVNLLGTETRFHSAGGVYTRCIEAGGDRPLILLHGVGGHAEAFALNIVPLSEAFRVIAVDALGFGLTASPGHLLGRDDYVRHLLDVMDALQIEKAHIAGESLGAWIGMWTAILHPERVDRLISICGARLAVAASDAAERHRKEGLNELRRLSHALAENPTRHNIKRRMEWLFRDPQRDLTEELVDLRWAIYNRHLREGRLRRSSSPDQDGASGNRHEFSPEHLRSISHPTLMLSTSHNPSVPAEIAERAAESVPNCQFAVMDDCGHWPQWEYPTVFNDLVHGFLSD